MKSIQSEVFHILLLVTVISAQLLDVFLWPDEDEEETSSDENWMFDYDYDNEDNSTSLKLLHLSSTEIKSEKELLEESSQMILDEVNNLMLDAVNDDMVSLFDSQEAAENDFIDDMFVNTEDPVAEYSQELLDEIISEHTVQLFNVLSQIKKFHEKSNERKLLIYDIFMWSNVSDEKINELLENYYQDS